MEVFGFIGVTFAIIAWGQISVLKKELKELKSDLEEKGVLNKRK